MKGKFLKTISDYISHYKLLKVNGKYLVALSGGADSVALLRVLLTLGYAVEAISISEGKNQIAMNFSAKLCAINWESLFILCISTQ